MSNSKLVIYELTLVGLFVAPIISAEEINTDKLSQIESMQSSTLSLLSVPSGIQYHADLYNTAWDDGSGIQGATEYRNINDSSLWEYYRFCANPGSDVAIEVHRTTYDMDPAIVVCQGTTDDSTGISTSTCGADMTFMGWADDNNGIPHDVGGGFADPALSFVAPPGPNPNEFTLAVFDFLSAGPSPQYEIHASGLTPCLIPVAVDIKPSTTTNSVNLCSNGAVPVAILGSSSFDVGDINPDSLVFAGAGVKVVGKKDPHTMCSIEDVNTDGFGDLVCHYLTTDLGALDGASTTATIGGALYDGTPIEGSDSVNIVKDACN